MLKLKQDFKEVLLRIFFILLFIGFILGISMNKILVAFNLKKVDPVTSVQFKNSTDEGFPIWSSFVCGTNLNYLTVQTLDISGAEIKTDIPNEYIRQTTLSSLLPKYIDTYDERTCFVFEPRKEFCSKLVKSTKSF